MPLVHFFLFLGNIDYFLYVWPRFFPSLSFSILFLISCSTHASVLSLLFFSLRWCYLDSKVTNQPLENPSGSIYISDSKFHNENPIESMLTSPRSNASENFIPSHHLALITQPVLGGRSRSRRKTSNILVETSTSNKEKFDSMTNSRQSSFHESPPLIFPSTRVVIPLQKRCLFSFCEIV